MSSFGKTRAVASYAVQRGHTELTRTRALVLLQHLADCEAALAGTDGSGQQPPTTTAGLLRSMVLAVRDLAGRSWLDVNAGDPDVAAFTAMQAAPNPPAPDQIDEICSRVLWARFSPSAAAS